MTAPEYLTPQPGERDSLDQLFGEFERWLARLTEEAFLHLSMYPDYLFANDLGGRISHCRAGLQNLEDEFWPAVGRVCE